MKTKSSRNLYSFLIILCIANFANAQTLDLEMLKSSHAEKTRNVLPERDLTIPVIFETSGIDLKIVFHKEAADPYFSHRPEKKKGTDQKIYEWWFGKVRSTELGKEILEVFSDRGAVIFKVEAPEGTVRYDLYVNGKFAYSGHKECLGSSANFFAVAMVKAGVIPDSCYLRSNPMLVTADNISELAGTFWHVADYDSVYKPLLEAAKEVEIPTLIQSSSPSEVG